MFEPFPGNYVWNLSVNICLAMGGVMGEIDRANAQVREIAREGEDTGTEAFFTAWGAMADRVRALGDEALAAGHGLSAATKYLRATGYYITAERMQSRHFAPRQAMYRTMLDTSDAAVRAASLAWERVEVRYGEQGFPGLFIPGRGTGPRPCLIFCNGLDSVKEMIALCCREAFAERGISVLAVDQPGSGEALRLRDMPAEVAAEHWAAAAIDALEARADVDRERIGMIGWSLGGYFAPRACAYERRLKLCIAWGGNHDWGELQTRRLAREGDRPVPHYWDHVTWVWGSPSLDAFMRLAPAVTLNGHLDRLKVPFLVVHGSNDRQIPAEYAQKSYDQAVNSPDRTLKFFTEREGGVEHVSADDLEPTRSYIADWAADRFAAIA